MRFFVSSGLLLIAGCAGKASDSDDSERLSDEVSEDTVPSTADGCASATEAQSQLMLGKTIDGLSRRFRFSAPAVDAGVKLPLLIAFHGADGADYPFPDQDGFEALVESEGVIMVYPVAELVRPNEGEWQLNTSPSAMHDIHFVEEILDEMSSRYCVDEQRIYATGYSLGSMFTYEMACHMSDRFAAVASYAGTMPVSPNSCDLDGSMAVMHIHGQDDDLISYDNSWDWKEWDTVGPMMDIPSLVDFWSEKNNCQNTEVSDSASGVHVVHDDCDGNVRVEHHGLEDVGHEWPRRIGGNDPYRVIWDFVSDFRKQ